MEETDQLIAKYLAGELSAEEARAFEKKVRSDPAIAQRVKEEGLLKIGVRMQGEAALASRLADKSIVTAPVKPLWQRPQVWVVAASIILVGVFLARFLFPTPSTPQELFAESYTSLPISGLRGETPPVEWMEAKEAYMAKDYEQAAVKFGRILPANLPPRLDVQRYLYLGMSYMELGLYENARINLEKVPHENVNRPYADWYVALSWLAEGNIEEGKKALRLLSEDDTHYRQQQAKELLEQLD